MNIFRFAVIGAAFLFSCAAATAPSLTPAQKAAICGKRATCKLLAVHNAGKFAVAEVLFGIKDKPDDAPDDGCRTADGGDPHNGGTEYWLLGAKPQNILALCNDGYGAASVGEDQIAFANNRMTHDESGGSAWRWQNTDVYSLSPFQLLSQEGCSFNDLTTSSGTISRVDFVKFRAVEIEKDPAAKWGDDDGIGCPDVKPAMLDNLKPIPDDRLVATYQVMMPGNATDATMQSVAGGTLLGSCALTLSTDGANGFLTFGKAADAAHAASMRALAVNSKTLLLQIYDPEAAPAPAGKSWIGGAHAEIWQNGDYDDSQGAPKRAQLGQIAIDLDGTKHTAGKVKPAEMKRWTGKDEKGRPVTVFLLTWANDIGPIVISYSQAESGRQARLVTTTAMARGVPMVLPNVATMQNRCAVRSGRFELAGMNRPTQQ